VNRPPLLRLAPRAPDHEEDAEMPAAPVPAPAAETAAVSLSGGQVSGRDQAAAAVGHGLRQAWRRYRQMAKRDGGLARGLASAKPPSIDEHFEYGRSRAWVPPGHQGGTAERLGVLHNRTAGAALVLIGNWISGTGHKPLRCYLTLALLCALTVTGLYAAGSHFAAAVMLAVLAGVAAAVAGLEKVTRPRPKQEED
jgi:hypothetical protein